HGGEQLLGDVLPVLLVQPAGLLHLALRQRALQGAQDVPSRAAGGVQVELEDRLAVSHGHPRSSSSRRASVSLRNAWISRARFSIPTSFLRFTRKSVAACARSFCACRFWLIMMSGPCSATNRPRSRLKKTNGYLSIGARIA